MIAPNCRTSIWFTTQINNRIQVTFAVRESDLSAWVHWGDVTSISGAEFGSGLGVEVTIASDSRYYPACGKYDVSGMETPEERDDECSVKGVALVMSLAAKLNLPFHQSADDMDASLNLSRSRVLPMTVRNFANQPLAAPRATGASPNLAETTYLAVVAVPKSC
jgi:hypothetical protein